MYSQRHKRIYFIIIILLFKVLTLGALDKISLWVTPWNLTDKGDIDQLIYDCKELKINEILAEVRYRGDALYIPNKYNHSFSNPEPRSYILNGTNFDPLDYLIYQAKLNDISVQAWVTVFVVTPLSTDKLPKNHLWFQKNDWITYKSDKTKMNSNVLEGAYLDPSLPEVREYLANVFSDIVMNYDVDGIHLDYIRYPDSRYGFHPNSLQKFEAQTALDWEDWREKQISSTVQLIRERLKSIKPSVRLTAAVKSNPLSAQKYFGQNWTDWLKKGWVDEVYLMAYHTKDDDFQKLMDSFPESSKSKIIVGLRSYEDSGRYPSNLLFNKIKICERRNFKGISFFSYSGIKESGYSKTICQALPNNYSDRRKKVNLTLMIEGKVVDIDRKPISGAKIKISGLDRVTFSDQGGYFVFYNLPESNYTMEVSYQDAQKRVKAKLKQSLFYQTSFNDIQLKIKNKKPLVVSFKGYSDNKNIFLTWKTSENRQFGLYRKTIYSPAGPADSLYQLIKILPENITFYTDKTVQPLFQYEYKLVDNLFNINEICRIELDFSMHPLDFMINKNDEWTLSARTADSLSIRWSILDSDETVLAYGINDWQAGLNQLTWNGLSTVGEKPKTDILIFEYQITGQKKWLRKYFTYN